MPVRRGETYRIFHIRRCETPFSSPPPPTAILEWRTFRKFCTLAPWVSQLRSTEAIFDKRPLSWDMGYFWFLGATPAKHPFLNISAPEPNIKNRLSGSSSMCWPRVYPKFQLTTLFGIGCRWGWAKKGSHIFNKEDSCMLLPLPNSTRLNLPCIRPCYMSMMVI